VWVSLDREQTRRILRETPLALGSRIDELLLATLGSVVREWCGTQTLHVELDGHGREDLFEDVDVSRTVGWFTSVFPACLDLGLSSDPIDVLTHVREGVRAIPQKGVGYGMLRHASERPEVQKTLAALPAPEFGFNYLGEFNHAESAFGVAPEFIAPIRSPRTPRRHLVGIVGVVVNREMHFEWNYSERLYRRDTIVALADRFIEHLLGLVGRASSS